MKKVIAFILSGLLLFCVPAYAADGDTTVDAGITPDSILYTADKLVEDIQLALTFDDQKDADLLLQFANERLAEAKVMTEEEKTEFVQSAVNDYLATLQKAGEKVAEVVTNGTEDQGVKDKLTQELDKTAQVDENVQDNLGDTEQEKLEQQTEEISFTANVVNGIDTTVVKSLRDKGLGFGQIAHIAALAKASGKTVDEISSLIINEKKGIGEVAKELGVQPSQMNPKARASKQEQTGKVESSTGTGNDATTGREEAVETPTPSQTTSQTVVSSTSTNTTKIETSVKNKDTSAVSSKVKTKDSKVTVDKDKSKDLKQDLNKTTGENTKKADKENNTNYQNNHEKK